LKIQNITVKIFLKPKNISLYGVFFKYFEVAKIKGLFDEIFLQQSTEFPLPEKHDEWKR